MTERLRPSAIRKIIPGDQVAASVVNTPLSQHQAELGRLYDLYGGLLSPSALVRRDATLDAACVPGTPVYLDDTTFKPAVAAADVVGGVVTPAPSSRVVGVVLRKSAATVGDVILLGDAVLDLTAVIVGAASADGLYYLSHTHAGKLVAERPPIGVPVLFYDGANVIVRPQFDDLSVHQRQHRFELVCEPAGVHEPPSIGVAHTITSPDANVEGWLPADHASFGGNAPPGAKFGYNLAVATDLADLWPPVPLDYAYLEIDRGLDAEQGFHGVPTGNDGLCVVDLHGIWWMSDCYGDVPWPTDYSTSGGPDPSEGPGECPRWMQMRALLWFTRPTFATDSFGVTSLTTESPRVTITCLNTGQPGAVGDLQIDVADLVELGPTIDEIGYLVVKSVDEDGLLSSGPVAEGVASASPEITITGDVSRTVGGRDYKSGLVLLTYQGSASQQLLPTEIRLDNVDEDFFENTMYLAMPAAQNSEIRGRYYVPPTLTGDWTISMRFWVLGKLAGTLPALSLTYRILSRPTVLLTDTVDLPTEDDEIVGTIDTVATLTAANQYVEASAGSIAVSPGDVVDFTLSRGDVDGYAAVVGLVQLFALLTAVEGP
jgi:hypothetical protein